MGAGALGIIFLGVILAAVLAGAAFLLDLLGVLELATELFAGAFLAAVFFGVIFLVGIIFILIFRFAFRFVVYWCQLIKYKYRKYQEYTTFI